MQSILCVTFSENYLLISGEPEQVNGYQIYLDLSRSIPYVSLLDGDTIRSVVIDMKNLEPKLINGMPMLFDTTTGRTYLQNGSVAKTSPMAYELVTFVTFLKNSRSCNFCHPFLFPRRNHLNPI